MVETLAMPFSAYWIQDMILGAVFLQVWIAADMLVFSVARVMGVLKTPQRMRDVYMPFTAIQGAWKWRKRGINKDALR